MVIRFKELFLFCGVLCRGFGFGICGMVARRRLVRLLRVVLVGAGGLLLLGLYWSMCPCLYVL